MKSFSHRLIEKLRERYSPVKMDFRAGDTIVAYVPTIIKNKEIQKPFEGVCIRKTASTFLLRKTVDDEAVEINFTDITPSSTEVVKSGKVRRARIYYWRDRRGKSARIAIDYSRKGKK